MSNLAPRSGEQAALFLREEAINGDPEWRRLCLKLQRTARGLPAVYPTAFSASMAVPDSEKITNTKDLKRGMVAFSYDPTIPGTAGHIFFIVGRSKNGTLLTSSNDVKAAGFVDVVPFQFYQKIWRQTFQFGATHLNNYDFSDFNAKPEPVRKGTLGDQYLGAIDDLERIRRAKLKKWGENSPLILALDRDINRMNIKAERFN